MTYQESETVELKVQVVDEIKKEIIAFANCDGGTLYIGVDDNGNVVGLDNPDAAALQISNMVRDAIKPDLTMFVHYETINEVNGKIVAVNIQRGTNRPYYIAKKGMRPEGVYVRQGYSSVPASDGAIRSMIKETDGDRFEEMRSLNQELTFVETENEFSKRNVEFGARQKRTLGLIDNDGLYSNLALLLSEQNPHTIKVAVFQGSNQNVFKDRREFEGSLLQQMNEVYDFIDFRNQTQSTFERLSRIDIRDYPEIAVREALLNLLVHRDYSFSASALISMYEDRLELVSVGGLLPGIELEDVMAGLSVCRNQGLANVFYRLQLIEAYGTGLGKIMTAYEGVSKKPQFLTTNNSFKIVLPNINYQNEKKYDQYEGNFAIPAGKLKENASIDYKSERKTATHTKKESRESLILNCVLQNGSVTRQDVENLLDVSASTAVRLLRKMVADGIILQQGNARSARYIAKYK